VKNLIFILFFFILNNCSLNKDSKFWTENSMKKKVSIEELEKIMKKSNDLLSLSFNEYRIFINEFNKKSKFPDISK
tara:strand:+ start:1053 stop:1280 length:228 start_codon:yes stop_codon:yes gene_type:complete